MRTAAAPIALAIRITIAVAVGATIGFGNPAFAGDALSTPPATDVAPADEAPAEPSEPAEPVEPSEPGDTTPPDEDGDGEGDDDNSDLVLWLVAGGLGILAIAAIAALVSSGNRRSQVRTSRSNARNQDVAQLVSSGRWVHDQSITVLQISDPSQLRGAWDQMRNQILQVERSVATTAARPEMAVLAASTTEVGTSLSALRSSLEAYVTVAARGDASRDVIDNAIQTVQVRRQQLEVSLSDLNVRSRNP